MISRLQMSQMAVLILITFLSLASASSTDEPLAQKDQAAIRTLLERFRNDWLSGNADAVRGTFTRNAVLMPHHGVPPVVGMPAINEFWWPAGSPKTTITRFTQTLDEIGGSGNIAYVRGRSEVAWTIENGKGDESWRTGGNFLALLRKQSDGKWLMSHLIWDDPPDQRLN